MPMCEWSLRFNCSCHAQPYTDSDHLFAHVAQDEDGAGGEGADEISASEARKRLERFRQRMKQEEARRQMDKVRGAGGRGKQGNG
jgi:hypothetical protein